MQIEDENVELLFKSLGLRHFENMPMKPNLHIAYSIFYSSIFVGIVFLYAAFISKIMPDTGIYFLDFMKMDYYFCYLIPLMVLPTYIVIYINWLAMKLFLAS